MSRGGGARDGSVRGGSGGGANQGSAQGPEFNAELWLVHRLPNGTADLRRQTLRIGSSHSELAFPPVRIASAQQNGSVEVSVRLRVVPMAAASPELELRIYRHVDVEGQRRSGFTGQRIPLPLPTEVISFELPRPKVAEDPLTDHQFSVRLRVTPR